MYALWRMLRHNNVVIGEKCEIRTVVALAEYFSLNSAGLFGHDPKA